MVLAGALFSLGTIVCAFSTSITTFLVGRAITGAGGAGILTLSSLITTDLTSLRERGYYQGLMMVLFGLGSAAGGPTAGLLSDRYGWVSLWFRFSNAFASTVFNSLVLPCALEANGVHTAVAPPHRLSRSPHPPSSSYISSFFDNQNQSPIRLILFGSPGHIHPLRDYRLPTSSVLRS